MTKSGNSINAIFSLDNTRVTLSRTPLEMHQYYHDDAVKVNSASLTLTDVN